jgi:cation/acetate symporter
MLVGLGTTLFYMIGSRFFGVSWFNTGTVASGVFGIPLGFITIWIVSLLTKAPPVELQQFVVDIRYPKTGGASAATEYIGQTAAAGAKR